MNCWRKRQLRRKPIRSASYGTLSRAVDDKQFVLTTADGQTLTFDRAAVKSHAVLGGSVGQQIVRVDLDHKLIPTNMLQITGRPGIKALVAEKAIANDIFTLHSRDKNPISDMTDPAGDMPHPGQVMAQAQPSISTLLSWPLLTTFRPSS